MEETFHGDAGGNEGEGRHRKEGERGRRRGGRRRDGENNGRRIMKKEGTEITGQVKKLKEGKAAGEDGINNEA